MQRHRVRVRVRVIGVLIRARVSVRVRVVGVVIKVRVIAKGGASRTVPSSCDPPGFLRKLQPRAGPSRGARGNAIAVRIRLSLGFGLRS